MSLDSPLCAKAMSALNVPNAARAGKCHRARTYSHILSEGFPISQSLAQPRSHQGLVPALLLTGCSALGSARKNRRRRQPSAQEIWRLKQDWFYHAKRMAPAWSTHIHTPSSPILLSPPQDNPPGQLEEFPSPGNISLISLSIPPLSHEAPSQPNKALQAVGEDQPGP